MAALPSLGRSGSGTRGGVGSGDEAAAAAPGAGGTAGSSTAAVLLGLVDFGLRSLEQYNRREALSSLAQY